MSSWFWRDETKKRIRIGGEEGKEKGGSCVGFGGACQRSGETDVFIAGNKSTK
jgi:hypothetical protein